MELIILVANLISSVFAAQDASMNLSPTQGWAEVGESFTVAIEVTAHTPVNVFQGDIEFDTTYLEVAAIDYNNSLADLWTTEPWYSNGDGTLSFAGGTTRTGGFMGTEQLLRVTFTTKKVGDAPITFASFRILKHDGLGTDADTTDPIGALFTVVDTTDDIVATGGRKKAKIYVTSDLSPTDLNGDGKQTIADISIFMSDLISQNPRSDFNSDGRVSLKDLSIITSS